MLNKPIDNMHINVYTKKKYKMTINEFDWDDANIEHIARHHVTIDEAAEVFVERVLLLRTRSQRYIALGQSSAGRLLTIVFEKGKKK